jgi:trehalose synthase
MNPPQRVMMPAIHPFTIKNRQLSDREINERLARYEIPTDLPLVLQVSRFDPWKDPKGVVDAFKLAANKSMPGWRCSAILRPMTRKGEEIFHSLCASREERILILTSGDDTALVNALQTRAAVVLQKSLREGFGLTVAEAMWKRYTCNWRKCGRDPLPHRRPCERLPGFLDRRNSRTNGGGD